MAGLLLPYTDPATGAVYPNAIRVVSGAEISQGGNYVAFVVSTYSSAAALANGLKPIRSDPITCTPAEVQSQIVPLATVLYNILLGRPGYTGATYSP